MPTLEIAVPKIHALPSAMEPDSAVRVELREGALVFKTSEQMCEQIDLLLTKEKQGKLTADEKSELDHFEEVDDYLSFLNRLTRNLVPQGQEDQGLVS